MNDTVRAPIILYAELVGGVVTGGDDPAKIGRRWFFINVVDGDGGRCVVWDGNSYADAQAALAEWRRDGVIAVDHFLTADPQAQ